MKDNKPNEGRLFIDGLLFDVRVLSSKRVFGRWTVLVTPAAGSGEKWINLDRLIQEG